MERKYAQAMNVKRIFVVAVLVTVFLLPADSRAERFGCTIIRTVYRLVNDPVNNGRNIPLAMDVYLPEPFDNGKEYPGVFFLYGCSWQVQPPLVGANINMWASHGIELAKRGYVSFAIDYRAAPLFFYPDPNEDAQYALDLITGRQNPEFIERFCRPINDVAIVGFSSGGNIAALMGTGRAGTNREHVRCIAVYSGLMDIRQSALLPPKTRMAVDFNYLDFQDAATYAEASPVCNVDKAFCPFLLQAGDSDSWLPVSQIDMMYDALQEQGIPVEKHIYDKAQHGFQFLDTRNGLTARSITLDFISKYVPPPY
jgi:acetyl esterase/lipase